jgi:hypothetical protein
MRWYPKRLGGLGAGGAAIFLVLLVGGDQREDELLMKALKVV